MSIRSTVLLLALACAGTVAAESQAPQALARTPAEFATSRTQIEAALKKTDRYSELTRSQREEIDRTLDRMQTTLAGVPSVEALDDKARTQLFNDQEQINNLLTRAHEDSRLICKREKRVGSHRYTNSCLTVAERRRLRESADDARHRQRGGRAMGE